MYSTLNEYGRPGRRYSGLGEKKVYTGLQYKDVYVGIISSVEGQIYDGIGEGFDRQSKMFQWNYEPLIDGCRIKTSNENGELVLEWPPAWMPIGHHGEIGLQLLAKCINSIARIERDDSGWQKSDDLKYEYLDGATGRDVRVITNVFKKLADAEDENEPWSEDKAEAVRQREEDRKAAEEETKRKADEEEAQKAFEKDQRINNAIDSTEPDSKDEQRAKDAARRAEYQRHTNKRISFMPAFYRLWQIQDAKITDEAKRKRRVVAFYNEAQKHEMSSTDDIRWRNDIYHIFKNN